MPPRTSVDIALSGIEHIKMRQRLALDRDREHPGACREGKPLPCIQQASPSQVALAIGSSLGMNA